MKNLIVVQKLFRKKILLFITVAILLGLVLVPSSTYANLIVNAILRQIDTAEVYVAVSEPDLAFIGLYSEELVVRPKQSFVGATLQEVRIKPFFSDLLRGQFTLQVSGKWLEGDFLVHWKPFRDELSLRLAEVQLYRFPLLQGLGFESGIIKGEILAMRFAKNGSIEAVEGVALDLKEFEKPGSLKLRPSLTKLPFPITIPDIRKASLTVKGSGGPDDLKFEDLVFKSSLGKISGGAKMVTKEPKQLNLALDGILTEHGHKTFGTTLKLFSNGRVKSAHQPFRVAVSGPLKPAPSIKISPIEQASTDKM